MSFIDPKQKVLWHLDKILELKQTGKTASPVNVEIDLSNRCSHGCAWCHFAYTHTKGPLVGKRDKPEDHIDGGDLMDYQLAINILNQLKAIGVQSITWTGGGEPTLHPNFNEIIEYTASIGLEQGLYTHGGHIDENRAVLLKRYMTFIYVSLDECTSDKFKVSKGVNRFSFVLNGIQNLVKASGLATIGIGFLLHKENYRDVDTMIELGNSLGVDYIQFRPIINYDQNNPTQLIEDTTWVSEAINQLKDKTNDSIVADLDRFTMYQNWAGHGYTTCNWSGFQTVITPNGKVWRCLNKREYADALLGDLTTESFSDIWSRSGGACSVNSKCRVMCRGHIANLTLDKVLTKPTHQNFI